MKTGDETGTVSLFECLEPRLVLYGPPPYPFVTAGVSFDPDTQAPTGMFWASGTVYADDTFTGSYERFDATARYGAEALPWSGFTRPDNDRMSLEAAAGFEGYASQNSQQFIAQQGFPAGSFVGRSDDGGVVDMGVFVEPFSFGPWGLGVYLQRDYFITTFLAMTPGGGLEPVTLVAKPVVPRSPTYTFEYFFASGTVTQTAIAGVITPTMTEFNNGVRVYSSQRGSTNFFMVDAEPSDGIVGFGFGLARFESPGAAGPTIGTYRGSVMTSGGESGAFFGVAGAPGGLTGAGVADVVIETGEDHTFLIYDADAYNHGFRTPVNSGTWEYPLNDPTHPELDRGRMELADIAGRVATFRTSRWHTMMIAQTVAGNAGVEAVWGVATVGTYTPITASLDFEEAVYSVDEAGHVIAYQHAISADADKVGWYSLDLVDAFGTASVEVGDGNLYSWHDLTFDKTAVVGRAVNGDLLFWQRVGGEDEWTYHNLTAEIAGAVGFAGEISGSSYAVGDDFFRRPRAAIMGTDADGKFIAYVQQSGGTWEFVSVEDNGLLGSGVHPDFAGPLAGFGTPWGGINFVGIDGQGEIWALWYSKDLGGKWSTDNLSQIAGGPPRIVSHLTGVTTPWNAFHVSGLDVNGHIIVTWWAREVGWRYDGLTELVGGPSFVGVELASHYNLELNVIAIVGMDAAGDAVVYWWSPKTDWNVGYPATGLSASTRPAGATVFDSFRVPYTNIPGLFASFQSITWQAADGHTKRLVWSTAAPESWTMEDLTELATPL